MTNTNLSRRITLTELGRRLNLSPRAVSQVLNGSGTTSNVRVNPKTRERVLQLAKETGYRPNRGAQMFRTGKHPGLVGIFSGQGFDPIVANRTYFSHASAEKYGLSMLQYLTSGGDEDELRAMDFFLDSGVEAVVSFIPMEKRHLATLLQQGVLVLSVGASQPIPVPTYLADKVEGFALLTRHLIEQGHSKITFIQNGPETPEAHGAYAEAGFLRAVAEARQEGKSVTARIHRKTVPIEGYISPDYPHLHGILAPGYAAMKEIIATNQVPEAVICLTDSLAHGAISACAEAGISVPEDIAIAAFGDEPWSSGGILTMTSVHQPLGELVEMAFADLKQTLRDKTPLVQLQVQLPCRLIVRQSTKHPRKS